MFLYGLDKLLNVYLQWFLYNSLQVAANLSLLTSTTSGTMVNATIKECSVIASTNRSIDQCNFLCMLYVSYELKTGLKIYMFLYGLDKLLNVGFYK